MKWSPVLVLAPGLLLLMGSNCDSGTGPSKYGFDVIEITSVSSDRFCDDPAGAKVVIEGTYTVRCTDEDQCGRALGEEYTVPLLLDGRAALDDVTLDNGDVISVWADCSEITGEVSGDHAVNGPGRDLGGISPDCTILFDGAAAVDLTDYTVSFTWLTQDVSGEMVCPGEPPFDAMEPASLEVDAPACTDGEALVLKGTGSVECRGSTSCTAGEALTFDYVLGPEPTTPEVTLSNGETLHLPYSCVHANVAVTGLINGERTVIGNGTGDCTLSIDEAQRADATELMVEADFGWLPNVKAEQACGTR